jgi:hypothetical protein
VSPYEDFFIASAGASAAILGLLVVAIAVVNADDGNPTTRELRTVLAGSAFVALVDIFMVSIVALTGGPVVLALSSLAMTVVGLPPTRRVVPRAKAAGNFDRGFRARSCSTRASGPARASSARWRCRPSRSSSCWAATALPGNVRKDELDVFREPHDGET